MGAFTSAYTGDELDLAISKILGETYRGEASPGCHLIGDKSEMPVFLNDITIPGKYTVYFYYSDPEFLADSAISPIFLHVYWAGQMLYQTIRVGPRLYWRDMISGDLTWKMIDMGVEAVRIVDNLYTDLEKDESADEMALSANMGAELRKKIEDQQIGNVNLLDCTDIIEGYNNTSLIENYWYKSNESCMIDEFTSNNHVLGDVNTYNAHTGFMISGSGYFITTNAIDINKNTGSFTASIYVNIPEDSIEPSESDIAYIKIILTDALNTGDSKANDIVFTKEINLKEYYQKYITDNCNTDKQRITLSINVPMHGSANESGISNEVVFDSVTRAMYVCFGMESTSEDVKIRFVQPKLEHGYYATAYNHSTNDLHYWYTNCEKIYDIDINAISPDEFNEQDGLVYNSETNKFNHEPIAVGGGGGFNIYDVESDADNNPRKDKILVFIPGDGTSNNPKRLIYWDGDSFESVTNPAMIEAVQDANEHKPLNDSVPYGCGWLNQKDETDSVPATLCYFDTDRGIWRPVGAVASKIWHMTEDPPTDPAIKHLIWIKTSTMAPYICVDGEWRPLLTIWGATT